MGCQSTQQWKWIPGIYTLMTSWWFCDYDMCKMAANGVMFSRLRWDVQIQLRYNLMWASVARQNVINHNLYLILPDLTWPDLTWPDLNWPDLTWYSLCLQNQDGLNYIFTSKNLIERILDTEREDASDMGYFYSGINGFNTV